MSDLWTFGLDSHTRRRYFAPEVFSHPAKLHLGLLMRLVHLYTRPGDVLFDPMAGTGSLMLAALEGRHVVLRDIEPNYVAMMHQSVEYIRRAGLFGVGCIDIAQADARFLSPVRFDHILTSPPYAIETTSQKPDVLAARARRLAENVGKSRRWQRYIEQPTHASFANGFRYSGGQDNIGNKSGRNYWREMRLVYDCCISLLPPDGKLILVLKNHYRRGKLVDVTGQTTALLTSIGLTLVAQHGRKVEPLSLWQRRRKEQGKPVVEVEDVLVFMKGSPDGHMAY